MYCPNCKQEYDGKFCPECGMKLFEKPAASGVSLNLGDTNAPTYIYLRNLYEKEGRDFSTLISTHDDMSR